MPLDPRKCDKRVPELAGLTPLERHRAVFAYDRLVASTSDSQRRNTWIDLWTVFGVITGMVVGFILWGNVWGMAVTMTVALYVLLIGLDYAGKIASIPKLRWFLRTPEGRELVKNSPLDPRLWDQLSVLGPDLTLSTFHAQPITDSSLQPPLRNDMVLDLAIDANRQPVEKFIGVIVSQAVRHSARELRFALVDRSLDEIENPDLIPYAERGDDPARKFLISPTCQGKTKDLLPPPVPSVLLFAPTVVVLCYYASVSYYSKGRVKGRIETVNPSSTWVLESEDLQQSVVLTRTDPHESTPGEAIIPGGNPDP